MWVFSSGRIFGGAAHQQRIKSVYAPINFAKLLYVLCVKDNQKGLHEELQWWFEGFGEGLPEGADTFVETDAGHGRIEVRRYTELPVTEQLTKAAEWTDACSVIRVERERELGDKRTCETVYYISSHAPNATFIAEAILPLGGREQGTLGSGRGLPRGRLSYPPRPRCLQRWACAPTLHELSASASSERLRAWKTQRRRLG